MQTVTDSAATTSGENAESESRQLLIRVDSTVYEVTAYFSQTAKETLEDKIPRLMMSEVNQNA
jgi:hypothetical protein